jgi:hypothetical protein
VSKHYLPFLLPAPAEWLSRRRLTAVRYVRKPFKKLHHRFSGLQRDWPVKIRNIWLQNILFLILISFDMIFNYPSHRHGTSVFGYSGGNPAAFPDLPAPGFLPVPVPGGRVSGHLFHGIHDRSMRHRSRCLQKTQR